MQVSDAIYEKICRNINIALKTKLQEPKELSNFPQISFPGKLCTGSSDAYQIKGFQLLKKGYFSKIKAFGGENKGGMSN